MLRFEITVHETEETDDMSLENLEKYIFGLLRAGRRVKVMEVQAKGRK